MSDLDDYEAAYWNFDARRAGTNVERVKAGLGPQTERDAFKCAVRQRVTASRLARVAALADALPACDPALEAEVDRAVSAYWAKQSSRKLCPAPIDIVFDGPPGHDSGRFVEVENAAGESVNAGTWIDRGNGMWALRLNVAPRLTDEERRALRKLRNGEPYITEHALSALDRLLKESSNG